MKDKLIREIKGIVSDMKHDIMNDREVNDDDVVALFEKLPSLVKMREDAEKWRRVKEMAKGLCNECILDRHNCPQLEFVNPCEVVTIIVETLTGEEE